ncbi:YeeE/YedE family protein, partial [filamentous cyanobacterium CCP3]
MPTQWLYGLSGGILIGLSATLLLVFNGRIAGISGMVNGAIAFTTAAVWHWLFLLGLAAGGLVYEYA